MVLNLKQNLPLKFDANTVLVDVLVENEMLNFIYEIKDIPVENFNDPHREKILRDYLVIKYCEYNQNSVMLKAFFPKGWNYIYYTEGKKVLMIHLDKFDCETD